VRRDHQRDDRHAAAEAAGRLRGLHHRRCAADGEEGEPLARLRSRLAELDAENKVLAKNGKPSITIKIYPADTSAAAALLAGRVDAYFADATPVLYYIKKTGGKFETAGPQIQSAPEGIATRKGDPLGAQFKTAIAKLYANGTMKTILARWGLSAFALKK
jgi:ABC-type amino acid transport substrate-binding protein